MILSQYDDPEYAVSLLAGGAAGYAYLLKDRVAEGDQLARAIREVASGGSMLDPAIVAAITRPIDRSGELSDEEEDLLQRVAQGTPIKAIAIALKTTPADVDNRIERLFKRLGDKYKDVKDEMEVPFPSFLGNSYDATHMIALAIKKAGGAEGPKLHAALENLGSYDGLVKSYNNPFSASQHEALGPSDYSMTVWKGTRLELMG